MKPITAIATITGLLIAEAFNHRAVAQTCPPGNPRVAPDSRYIDHGDDTVTDRQTGLMWKHCSEGQSGSGCNGTASSQNWSQALATASASNFAGHSDWRLPSVNELRSLLEIGCYAPSINTTLFPNTPSTGYWSATTYFASTSGMSFAWTVGFHSSTSINMGKSGNSRVRLVRAGE